MNKDPRGLCVIVNNVNFQNRDLNRPGAVEDERSLQLLFRTLFFEVIIRRAERFTVKNGFVYTVIMLEIQNETY